jgi:hypothetical protein
MGLSWKQGPLSGVSVGRLLVPVSFEPDMDSLQLDGIQLRLEPGQTVILHGPDRDLDAREAHRPANG